MDRLGHEVERPGGEAYAEIVREFGSGILHPDGTIDRRKLAGEVFGKPERLKHLNAIVHPLVWRKAQALEAEFFGSHPDGIAVTEAAILIETGSYKDFHKLILAICTRDQQVERAMARDGLTREEVLNRLARQMSLEEKMKYADYVIDTSGSKEQTRAQTESVYASLQSLRRTSKSPLPAGEATKS